MLKKLSTGIIGLYALLTGCTTVWDEEFECSDEATQIIQNSQSQVYRHKEEIADILTDYIPKDEQVVSFDQVAESMKTTPFKCGNLKLEYEVEQTGEYIGATFQPGEDHITLNNALFDSFNEEDLYGTTKDELLGLYTKQNGWLVIDKDKVKELLDQAEDIDQKHMEVLADLDYLHKFICIDGEDIIHENTHKVLYEQGKEFSHTDKDNPREDNVSSPGMATASYLLVNKEFEVAIEEAYQELIE